MLKLIAADGHRLPPSSGLWSEGMLKLMHREAPHCLTRAYMFEPQEKYFPTLRQLVAAFAPRLTHIPAVAWNEDSTVLHLAF
jgi:hypothetical protein